jgi:hypothetical protein
VRPPVVTVSCPSCGGKVKDAELGDQTTCKYCGTDLHLPEVGYPDRAPVEHTEEAPPVRRTPGAVVALVAILGFGTFATFFYVLRRPSSIELSSPRVASPPDPQMAGVECSMACTKPCMEISDPQLMLNCMNKCDDRCKYVGKGTPAECRARCTTTCAPAPDDGAKSACTTSCFAKCPPQ